MEGDNASVLKDCEKWTSGASAPLLPLARELLRVSLGINALSFSCVPRQVNVKAHNLVKKDVSPSLNLRVYPS